MGTGAPRGASMMDDVRGLMYVGSLVFEHELHELNEFIRNYEKIRRN